ncbi:unnamed protein product [Dicrocoelium dendriticum]|nr:unnamed protein product [Dicrocoelium dendriticum]
MSQKIFEPLKRLPHQIQNLHLIQRLHGLALGRPNDVFGSYLSSVYGCPRSPCALAYDARLGLLAVGWGSGLLKVYGAAGVVLTVQSEGDPISHLCFLPEEGRLLSAFTTGCLALYELDPKNGKWAECCRIRVACSSEECITSMALGHGILYVGSSVGTVYQVAIKNGRMYLGDPTLTALTSSVVVESLPADKRDTLSAASSVIALEIQPDGFLLLIAYTGGCVAVAIPQPAPEMCDGIESSPAKHAPTAPTVEQEASTPATEENCDAHIETAHSQEPTNQLTNGVTEQTSEIKITPQAQSDAAASGAHVKERAERRATLMIKELTRSLRRTDSSKRELETEPPVAVPPAPRISHVLLRDQPVEWATWRVTSLETQPDEITVAYGDGAFQVWPITAVAADQELSVPLIVSKREPPTTPYGPLPCGSIKKILQSPGFTGGILTAFSGGLPRAEFNDRHAVTVLQDQEHHVCFQFGSEVKDFIFIPDKCAATFDSAATTVPHTTGVCPPQCASALVVLTDRELVAIDLRQPNWPVFASPYLNCLDISPITAVNHLSKVSTSLLDRLFAHSRYEYEVSLSKWPIWGGECGSDHAFSHAESNDMLILGYANGSISLVHIGPGDSLYRLGTFNTDILFNLVDSQDGEKCGSMEVETWPPFRRVGDCALAHSLGVEQDSRLAVTQLVSTASDDSLTIVVGGAAGQVSLWTLHEQSAFVRIGFEPDIARVPANLMEHGLEHTKYIWKGLPALRPFEGVTQSFGAAATGFSPCALVQLDPPAPITSLALQPSWHLLAIGSPHGFAVVDLLAKSTVYSDFFFAKSDGTIVHKLGRQTNAFVNRGKQITATMRQSFRRLKHLRTSTTNCPNNKATDAAQEVQPTQPVDESTDSAAPAETGTAAIAESAPTADLPASAVADQPADEIDAAPAAPLDTASEDAPEPIQLLPDEFGPSTVRALLFADTYVVSPVSATNQQSAAPPTRTPSLWVGTANGCAVAHGLNWDGVSGPVTVQLHKELQLQHHAPVIGLSVIDAFTRSPVLSSQRIRTSLEPETKAADESEPKPEASGQDVSVNAEAEPAALPTPAPEVHQLLLCSEEQVKLFQLPSLRALHKHKFVERIRLPGHLGGSMSFSGHGATTEHNSKQDRDTNDLAGAAANEATAEPAVHASKPVLPTQSSRKRLTAFGIQAFSRGTGDQTKVDWNVVVTRHDGQTVILSLPNLRKLFKVKACVDSMTHPVTCVAPPTYANLVLWSCESRLLAVELSFVPRFTSPALLTPGTPSPLPATIVLPEWARPKQSIIEEPEEKPVEVAFGDTVATEPVMVDIGEPAHNGTNDVPVKSDTVCLEIPDKSYLPAVSHAGDMTIDSIKEYLNGDGAVTVKTVETTSEKRTLVDGGHVTITLRETEEVDGKITKDDLLKFSTDEPPSVMAPGVA